MREGTRWGRVMHDGAFAHREAEDGDTAAWPSSRSTSGSSADHSDEWPLVLSFVDRWRAANLVPGKLSHRAVFASRL